MQSEKNPFNILVGKMIVTKEGKRLGFVKDITFETRSGELKNLVLQIENVNKNVEGKKIVKFIYIKNKIVNIVVN